MSVKVKVEEKQILVTTWQVKCELCGVVHTAPDYHAAHDYRLHHEISHYASGGVLFADSEDSDQDPGRDKPVDG